MKASRFFSRPIVPAFLSSGKYRNCLRENVIVGAEQHNLEFFFDLEHIPPPIKTLEFVYRYAAF